MASKALKRKKVLITGGLGFIGSNLAHKCLELGDIVTIYDCLDPKSGGNMFNIKDIENDLSVVINDIRNFENLAEQVKQNDVIFNCAAYTSHPNAMREPLIDIDVNCKGVINLLESIKRFNPSSRLIHIGTSTQIGKMIYDEVDELHPEFPVDIYSANKSVSEKYVMIYAAAYNINATVVRLSNVYGPRSNIQSSDFGFMNFFIGLALKNKNLTVYGKGDQLRSLIYIDDAVNALLISAESNDIKGEVFFASGDEQYNINTIAHSIQDVIGGNVMSVEWPSARKVIEIGNAVISNKKIKGKIDWQPKINLKEGLQLTKEYFSKRLDHYLS